MPIESIRFGLPAAVATPWKQLHPWVLEQTADLRGLEVGVLGKSPFTQWPSLFSCIEQRFTQTSPSTDSPERKPWLHALGSALCRFESEDAELTERVRETARRLSCTRWQKTPGATVTPYIDGKPAGTPRPVDVVWVDDLLHVDDVPLAKLARRVPEEVGSVFGRADIKAALDYSFNRTPEDVREYMEQNFQLSADVEVPAVEDVKEPEETSAAPLPEASAAPHQHEPFTPGAQDTSSHPREGYRGGEPSQQGLMARIFGSRKIGASTGHTSSERPPIEHTPLEPQKPSLIERFAMAQGFEKRGGGQYVHPDGFTITREPDAIFPWKRTDNTGRLAFLYPIEHCFELAPLVVEAEVWGMLEKHGHAYSLVLLTSENEPIEVKGNDLRTLREAGSVTLYPASYRLVRNAPHSQRP
jgi:hypothetical protein